MKAVHEENLELLEEFLIKYGGLSPQPMEKKLLNQLGLFVSMQLSIQSK